MYNLKICTLLCYSILYGFIPIIAQVSPSIDIDGTIQIRENAARDHILQSDANGLATWVEPSTVRSQLCITDFGATSDDLTDDTAAIQAAIDSAAVVGAKLCVPFGLFDVSQTLNVPAGVILEGNGRGFSSTLTPSNQGSIIRNTGTDWTFSITGHNAGLRDLVIYDTNNIGAAGGVLMSADGMTLESVILFNVLIFGFTDGCALQLDARNSGGLAYCSFYDLQIRHAKTGICITQDATSYVNSNSFYHGAISGGDFDHCLLVKGGNNNVFNGMIMEPFTSTFGHIVVDDGEIIGHQIRVEGAFQPNTVPLIEFKENTSRSYLSGTYGGGLTLDRGDNFIDMRSGLAVDPFNAGLNQFENSAFLNVENTDIPYWDISGPGVTFEILSGEILYDHKVLKLTIPAGVSAFLRPDPAYAPTPLSPHKYDQCTFGAHIKTDQPDRVRTIANAPLGVVSSVPHNGDNEWHFTGMTCFVDRMGYYNPKFLFSNTSNINPLVVYISNPTLHFGSTNAPEIEAKPITTTGGIISGTLSTALLGNITVPPNGRLVLSKEANVFEINGTIAIQRINDNGADQFPKGTIITLLFDTAGISVVNGAYINLISPYISTINSSLTLVSKGNGIWREMDRNL